MHTQLDIARGLDTSQDREDATELLDRLERLIAQIHDKLDSRFNMTGDTPEEVFGVRLGGFEYHLTRARVRESQEAGDGLNGAFNLTPREQEIVRMVALGHPNKTIAAVLEISAWTVGTHLRHVFAKLGVSSRAAMIARLTELDASG